MPCLLHVCICVKGGIAFGIVPSGSPFHFTSRRLLERCVWIPGSLGPLRALHHVRSVRDSDGGEPCAVSYSYFDAQFLTHA